MSESGERRLRAMILFEELCELEGEELARRLEEACAGDAALRAEVESLLAVDEDAGEMFDSPALGATTRELAERALEESAGPALPERIGPYRILSVLGEGGMGLVYEAEQRSPQRRVALKVVHPSLLRSETLARFEREAVILGRLQHPGIAAIYEAGSADLGRGVQPFLAMELVQGVDLSSFVRAQVLGVEQRVELVARLCDAVHHAHEQGIVHRDLKPDNVLVTAEGQPKVLDFGVAAFVDGEARLTQDSGSAMRLIGTLAYMSPEQARGETTSLGPPCDVYSLGAMLFELLAGRTPHALRGLAMAAAVRVVQEDEATRLGTLEPELPRDLDAIVGRALEQEPRRRYANAQEMGEDLRRFLRHETIVARAPTAIERARKYVRRHRAFVYGMTGTMLALLVGAVLALVFALRARENERLALRESYRARLEASLAGLVTGEPEHAALNLELVPKERRVWSRVRGTLVPRMGAVDRDSPIVLEQTETYAFAKRGDALLRWRLDRASEPESWPQGTPITSLALERHRNRITVGLEDGRVRTLAASTGQLVDELQLAESSIDLLSWDALGTRLAFGNGGDAWIWEAGEVRLLRSRTGFPLRDVQLDPSGRRALVTFPAQGANRGALSILDVETGEQINNYRELGGFVFRSPRFSPDGSRLAIGGHFGMSDLVDGDSLELIRRLGRQRGRCEWLCWSKDSKFLATGSMEGEVVLREGQEGRAVAILSLSASMPELMRSQAAAVSTRGEVLLSADERVWSWSPDPSGGHTLEGHDDYVYSIAFADNRTLVSLQHTSPIKVWDVLEQRCIASLKEPGGKNITCVGDRVFRVGGGGFREYDLATLNRADSTGSLTFWEYLIEHPELAPGLRVGFLSEFTADGALHVRLREEGTRLSLLRAADGEAVVEAPSVDTPYSDVAIDAEGRWMVDASDELYVYEVATGQLVARLVDHSGDVYSVRFSPDGGRLASGGADGTVRLWDTETWELLLTLRAHDQYVRSLAWSPDGRILASASGDEMVRLWDSVSPADRQRERVAWGALKDSVRPVVAEALASSQDAQEAAERLRAEASFGEDERVAALRVLLESVRDGE